ncbi:MAG: metallophosphoesterase [Phycisphaerales bacterium]|jgi:predicted MPP superfamily phosphohydrolase
MASSPEETTPPDRQEQIDARRRNGKYRRASLRHRIVAVAANTIARGELTRRHVAQPMVVRHHECVLPEWPAAFDGVRIAHYSDLHMGSLLPLERGLEAIELVRRTEADLVAFTGDLVDLDIDGVEPLVEAMASIRPSLGHHLVLGNHDHLDDPRGLVDLAREAGLSVLQDESVALQHGGGALRLAGIDWGRGAKECRVRVDSVCNRAGGPIHLLLAHNPQAFPEASRRGVCLTLSGHTHGGQVARRKRPDHNLAIAHRFRSGFYARDERALFVTKGLGAWFPLRLHCDPEVVVLTVRRGSFALPPAG